MKVSICMITYNHEKYISQAIEGILMQETNFDYQLVIGEDCSPDNTRKICEEYAEKYPDKIKLLPSDKNHGVGRNFTRTFKACDGEYMAFCEGDDFWTAPDKLQRQFDIMEKDKNISIVCHDVDIVYEEVEEKFPFQTKDIKQVFTYMDEFNNHFVPSLSMFYRKDPLMKVIDQFNDLFLADLPLILFCLTIGDGYYIFDKLATKRRNPGGVTQDPARKIRHTQNILKVWTFVESFTPERLKKPVKQRMANYQRALAQNKNEKLSARIKYFLASIFNDFDFYLNYAKR